MSFPHARAFIISAQTLREQTNRSSRFLFDCYLRFSAQIKPVTSGGLVLVWKEDYDRLFNFYIKHQQLDGTTVINDKKD